MSLKLKPREKLLAANAIGNIKLALTSDDYPEALSFIVTALAAMKDLNESMSGKLPVALPTGGMDGKGNVTSLKKDT